MRAILFLAFAACAGSHPAPASPPLCFNIERGVPALPPSASVAKLDADLRILLSLRRAERVPVTVELRGSLADLEAIGFVKDSAVTHPTDGYTIATGTLPIDALEAASKLESVVEVSAPVPLGPATDARR
jgi:hypothetical protein